jgi:hypothetical protein
MTYHAPRQNVATPAATAIWRGRLSHGRMPNVEATSSTGVESTLPGGLAFCQRGGDPALDRVPRVSQKPRIGAEVDDVAVHAARQETSADRIASLHAAEARRIIVAMRGKPRHRASSCIEKATASWSDQASL